MMNRALPTFSEALAPAMIREEMKLAVTKDADESILRDSFASPSVFLSAYLGNIGVEPRINAFSVEQARYFLPYQESSIPTDMIRWIREEVIEQFENFTCEELSSARSELGETLVHHACRWGKLQALTYLMLVADLPLNVRDKFGRNPLHNACSAAVPNFAVIDLLMCRGPDLVLYEDDRGKTPFDCIPRRLHGVWTRYLYEKKCFESLRKR